MGPKESVSVRVAGFLSGMAGLPFAAIARRFPTAAGRVQAAPARLS